MDSFCLQPASVNTLCPYPIFHIIQSAKTSFLPSPPMLCISVWLIHFLCTILSECSRCPQLNISGSCSLPGLTTKITSLIVRQLLTLNCRNSYLLVFLLHEFTRPLRALTYLCRPRTQYSSWSLLCSKNSETLVQTSLQSEFIALPFWLTESVYFSSVDSTHTLTTKFP